MISSYFGSSSYLKKRFASWLHENVPNPMSRLLFRYKTALDESYCDATSGAHKRLVQVTMILKTVMVGVMIPAFMDTLLLTHTCLVQNF